MSNLSQKWNINGSSELESVEPVNQLQLEENKRLEVIFFCKSLIETIKDSVIRILNNEESISHKDNITEEVKELKKNINEYSIQLSLEDDLQIKALNTDLAFLMDELEELYTKIQEVNTKILLIDKNNSGSTLFKITYKKDRKKLVDEILLKNNAIDKLYEYKIALFKRNIGTKK